MVLRARLTTAEAMNLFGTVIGEPFATSLTRDEIWFEAHETNDPIFSCYISAFVDAEKLCLGEYPEITLAQQLRDVAGLDSIMSHYGLIAGLDPQNPFWCLLHEDGRWFFADTSRSRLEFPDGKPGVDKRGELDLSSLIAGGYRWDHSSQKLDCQQLRGADDG